MNIELRDMENYKRDVALQCSLKEQMKEREEMRKAEKEASISDRKQSEMISSALIASSKAANRAAKARMEENEAQRRMLADETLRVAREALNEDREQLRKAREQVNKLID